MKKICERYCAPFAGKKMDANLRSDSSAFRFSCPHLLASKHPGLKENVKGFSAGVAALWGEFVAGAFESRPVSVIDRRRRGIIVNVGDPQLWPVS